MLLDNTFFVSSTIVRVQDLTPTEVSVDRGGGSGSMGIHIANFIRMDLSELSWEFFKGP